MTRHIIPLYVKAHFNRKPMSKVLIDNGLRIKIMTSNILCALRKNTSELMETEVSISTFIGEISKTLRILSID